MTKTVFLKNKNEEISCIGQIMQRFRNNENEIRYEIEYKIWKLIYLS